MSEQWHMSRNGQKYGPFTLEQLKEMIGKRQLVPTDQLWKAGMAGWAPAGTIPGLFAADPLDAERTRAGKLPPPLPAAVLDVESTVPRQRPAPKPAPAVALDVESTVPRSRPPNESTPAPSLQETPPQRSPSSPPPIGHELKVGHVLDKFLITKTLGRGGMGVVYKATDQETEVDYAIKVLTPELVADPRALADLKKEVAVAQALTHQNLLKVNYLAASGSVTYVVMEYIDGENLEEYRLRKGGKLSLDEFRKIAPQVLAGLDYLHEKGVVHLDIKPHNIMLTKTGEVKITDYGIARTIKEQLYQSNNTETPTGTLVYMAPEQLRGGQVCDRRADIYAVGMMFQRLMTGRFPFDERNREGIVKWHLDSKHAIASSGTVPLNRVLEKALEVDAGNRYSSCRELVQDLSQAGLVADVGNEVLEVLPAGTPPMATVLQGLKPREKEGLMIGGGVIAATWVLLLLLSSLTGWFGWILKAVILIALVVGLTLLVGERVAPPDRAGRQRRLVFSLSGGLVLGLLFAGKIGGFFSSFFFSGALALGLLGTVLLRGGAKPIAAACGGAMSILMLGVLLFGGPGADESSKLVGVWVQTGGSTAFPGATLTFSSGGTVSWGERGRNDEWVARYRFDGKTMTIYQDKTFGNSVSYDAELSGSDELLLGGHSGGAFGGFSVLKGRWQRAEGDGPSKGTVGGPSLKEPPIVKKTQVDPRLIGKWRIMGNNQTVEFTKGGSLLYGKETRPYRAGSGNVVEVLYQSGGVDERLTLDFQSDDELVIVNSTTFGSLAGIAGRLTRIKE
jgi:hypothetical protein